MKEKMRIAVMYDSRICGRDDGPPLFYLTTLRELGHNVDMVIPTGDLTMHGKYDLTLHVDWGEDGLLPAIPYTLLDAPHPNVYICSDTHIGYDYRLKTAKKFDLVLCNQLRGVQEFEKQGIQNVFWHPNAFHPLAYNQGVMDPQTGWKTCAVLKRHDVCFIGHANTMGRIEFLDTMFKAFPNFFYGQKLFDQAATVFNESKIVLNQAWSDDINMRVFESMGSGSLLLTPRVPTVEMLFTDGVHCVMYDSTKDAIEKAHFYLAHDEEREKIAKAGYDLVHEKHTYAVRAKRMIELFESVVSHKEAVA